MIYMAILTPKTTDASLFIEQWGAPEDREQAKEYGHPERKQAFLAGRSSLRALLDRVTERKDWQIVLQPGGKPYLVAADGRMSPFISISHTRGMVACAVSFEGEVGIDVEFLQPRDFVALADYAFNPSECEVIAREGMPAFYRLWTLKEAWAKAQGKSIFQVLKEENCLSETCTINSQHEPQWSSFSTVPSAGYSLSCVIRARASSNQKQFTFVQLFN